MPRGYQTVLGLLCCFTLLTSTAVASPITYYISSSTGSDANDGLAPDSAWKSLSKVEPVSSQLEPGSSVLLRAGDDFVISESWFLTGMSASEASPISISYFGSGDRPRVGRSSAVPAGGPTLTINNSSGIVITGISFVGGENGVAFTHAVRSGESGSTYDYFVITDCVFESIHGLHYNASSGSWWGSAVAFAAYGSGVTITRVSITHNLCNDSDVFYINSVPYSGFTRSYVEGLNITDNTITFASYNTLFLDTTAFVLIARNVFAHDTPQALFVAGTTDIIMGTLNSSVSIQDNEISYRGEYQPGGPDGCAVDFETFADGVSFVRNYVYRSFGAGIMVFGHGHSSINLVISDNIMLYNGCGQTRDDHGGIAFIFVNSTGTISGNKFATCPEIPLFYQRVPGASAGWTFTDNVIDGEGGVSVRALGSPVITSSRDAKGTRLCEHMCSLRLMCDSVNHSCLCNSMFFQGNCSSLYDIVTSRFWQ